jgi:hypothetical protein
MEDPAIRKGICALDSNGFRPGSGSGVEMEMAWNGGAFWKQFAHWRKNWVAANQASRPALTDLYAKQNRQGS